MIVVRVVGGNAEQRPGVQLAESDGVGDVPHALDACVRCVAEVPDAGMAVVDLEEILFEHVREILGGDAPAEIGVVQVGQDRLAGLLLERQDRAEIVAHRVANRVSFLRLDHFREVDGVDMHRLALELVGDLLAFDE